MPIKLESDSYGTYFIFGTKGHKYYFHDEKSMEKAYDKCLKQARAIEWSKHKK